MSRGFFTARVGFKFGWLSKPAPAGERQRGLLEESVRTDAAGPAWYAESVDLCALYQREYALPCRGEHVLYIGVTTDADGSRSVAEADYADFELDAVPSGPPGRMADADLIAACLVITTGALALLCGASAPSSAAPARATALPALAVTPG